jgi:PST family polysaccharide transporter
MRTTIGVIWLIGTRLCLRSLGLVSTIILARLLFPADFGLIAIATALLSMLNGASNLGFNAALIKFQTYDRKDLDTAWTLNLIRGSILASLALAASFYLPGSLNEPRLGPILQIMALAPFLSGMANTALIGFEKELDYSRQAYLQVIAKVASTVTTITVALLYHSYWALIAGIMTGSIIRLITGYILYPYMPRPCFTSTRKLFGFSIWLSLSHFVNATSASFDKILSAALFATSFTGLYHMGQEISALLTREIFEPLNRALYPGLAKFSNDPEKLKINALESVSVLAGIGLPIGIGFAFVASEFVPIVLGSKWLDIVPMVQILAPVLGLQTLTNAAHATLLSLGMTKTLFVRSLFAFLVRLPLLIIGGYKFGFSGLVVAHALSEFISFFINYLVLGKVLDCKSTDLFKTASRSFISVSAMAMVLLLVHTSMPAAPSSIFALLAAMLLKVAVGAATYTAAHFLLWHKAGKPDGFEARVIQIGRAALVKAFSSQKVEVK